MKTLPLEQLPDPDLVDIIRGSPGGRQTAAFDELESRHRALLRHLVNTRVHSLGSFLATVGRGSVGDLIADVLGQAIRTFSRTGGASFRTYVVRILENEMINGFRKPARFITGLEGEDGERQEHAAKRTVAPGSLPHLALLEIVDLGRACLAALGDRPRRIFVWGVVVGFSSEELHDLFPEITLDNLRQIKSRACMDFFTEWERRGGPVAEEMVESAGRAMGETLLNPDRIADPKAREAYQAWLVSGLAGAAKELKRSPEETRKLLLSAAHDLYGQVTFRGRKAARTRAEALALALEVGGGSAANDALLAQARRTIDIVRAAFGFAPMEAAVHTLGSFVQERLRSADDYRKAQKALGLTPAAFRRLLANDFEPEKEVFARLATFTGAPAARLRALPRRPLEEPHVSVRGSGPLDLDRVRERALRWLRPAR